MTISIKESQLKQAAEEGYDAFVGIVIQTIKHAIGGELNVNNMQQLNSDQITLLAWDVLHTEVMDGGLIQLIHNGYGPFIYKNPTDQAFRAWELFDLFRWVRRSHSLWRKYRERIECDCTEDEFMALFEQMPEFDDFDDMFVEKEEEWTKLIAHYLDDHLSHFVTVDVVA